MKTTTTVALAASLLTAGLSTAQTTVNFADPSWQDFGTMTTIAVAGNFQPGWETLQATPDVGVNVFSAPNQSLSGAPDDAALWFNQFDASNSSNEVARLSLDGFSIGEVYSLDFFATILQVGFNGWTGTTDQLEVAITGTTSSSFTSTVLTDAGDADGMNTWEAQSILFTAMDTTVTFSFGANAIPGDTNISRLAVDGFSLRVIPTPAAASLFALAGFAGVRRRQR